MNNPLVSILIPNYNKGQYLRETLDSILNQTFVNWECIIVDDHSTDDSWEILKEYADIDSRFRIYKRLDNLKKGANPCRNYALTLSKGMFVNWFDSDDLMELDFLKNRIVFLQKNDSDFIIIGGRIFTNQIGDVKGFLPPLWVYPGVIEAFIIANPPWNTLSCMFRKEFLITNNLVWNEKLLGLHDDNFNLNAFTKGNRISISYKYCDYYWRLNEEGSSTGGNLFTYEKFGTLFEFIFCLTKILNYQLYYKSIRNCSFEFLYNSKKRISLKWFQQLVIPLYRIGIIKSVELIKIGCILIDYYVNKRNETKSYNIINKMGELLLRLEPNLKNLHRVVMPVNEKEFDERMQKMKVIPNQTIIYQGKEFIVLN